MMMAKQENKPLPILGWIMEGMKKLTKTEKRMLYIRGKKWLI